MRPYFVELFNRWLGTQVFTYLVPNYFILLSLGAIVGMLYAARRARKAGLDEDVVYGLAMWGFPVALIGGRLLHFAVSPSTYRGGMLVLLDPLKGSNMAYGGFIGGTLAVFIYLWRRRVDIWRYLDCAVPAVGIGACFARLGCFLEGDDFGKITSLPLAVRFPRGSFAFYHHVKLDLLSPLAASSLPVHPVQLYLALDGLLLATIAVWWNRSRRATPGEAFCVYWLCDACTRFGLEFLRGDLNPSNFGLFTDSQMISICVVGLSGYGLWQRLKHRSDAHDPISIHDEDRQHTLGAV